jgi:tetratricopeptide (TPR) repeat protein
VADGKVYIGSIEEDFYCLDACTGKILWKYETGPIYSAPAISQGRVLISSTDGNLYCFGIDPETYKAKAEKYIEVEKYRKAEEFLIKAKEYAETNDEIKEIEELLDLVDDYKKEYQERQEKIEEAESLMDRADEILWNDQFKEAQNLYKKARKIYKKVDDEFGVSFCESRIEYIQERIPEEERGIPEVYLWILVIVICVATAAILLKKVR